MPIQVNNKNLISNNLEIIKKNNIFDKDILENIEKYINKQKLLLENCIIILQNLHNKRILKSWFYDCCDNFTKFRYDCFISLCKIDKKKIVDIAAKPYIDIIKNIKIRIPNVEGTFETDIRSDLYDFREDDIYYTLFQCNNLTYYKKYLISEIRDFIERNLQKICSYYQLTSECEYLDKIETLNIRFIPNSFSCGGYADFDDYDYKIGTTNKSIDDILKKNQKNILKKEIEELKKKLENIEDSNNSSDSDLF